MRRSMHRYLSFGGADVRSRLLAGRAPNDLSDDEIGSVLALDVQASEVLPKDSEHDELGTAQDQHGDDDARPPLDRIAREPASERIEKPEKAQNAENESQRGCDSQRPDREARD